MLPTTCPGGSVLPKKGCQQWAGHAFAEERLVTVQLRSVLLLF